MNGSIKFQKHKIPKGKGNDIKYEIIKSKHCLKTEEKELLKNSRGSEKYEFEYQEKWDIFQLR